MLSEKATWKFFNNVVHYFSLFQFSYDIYKVHGMGLMEGHYGLYYLGGEKGMLPIIRNIWYAPEFLLKMFLLMITLNM